MTNPTSDNDQHVLHQISRIRTAASPHNSLDPHTIRDACDEIEATLKNRNTAQAHADDNGRKHSEPAPDAKRPPVTTAKPVAPNPSNASPSTQTHPTRS